MFRTAGPVAALPFGASPALLRHAVRALAVLIPFLAAAGAPAEEPPPTRTVALRVVDRLGRPVADVSACLLPACTRLAAEASGDGLGVTLPAPAEGAGPVRLRLEAPGFLPAEVDVPAAPSGALPVRMTAKGSVSATFLSLDERQEGSLDVGLAPIVPVAEVGVPGPGKTFVEKRLTLPKRPGRAKVAFDDVPPGTWALVFSGPGIAAGMKALSVAGKPADAGTLGLTPGFAVEGAVRDDLGVPVRGARVLLQESASFDDREAFLAEAVAGDDGGFGVPGVPAERPVLWVVRAAGHMEAKGRLGGETRLEVVLERAQRVDGRVIDADGAPVRGAAVTVRYVRERSSRNHGRPIETDEDGAFAFHREMPDRTAVEVKAEGFRTLKRELEPLAEAGWPKETSLGDLMLDPGRSLRGRTVDGATGAAVGGVDVKTTVARKEGSVVVLDEQRATTDAEGRFELSGLPPEGPVTLAARATGYAPKSLEVSEEAEEVEVLLGKGGRVEGRLCGRPHELARSEVQMERPGLGDPREGAQKPDASGRFVFTGVEPGRRTFARAWVYESPLRPGSWAMMMGGTRGSVEVEEGRTVTLELGCAGIPFSGLLLKEGAPFANKVVVFTGSGESAPDAMTDGAGRFSTFATAPGSYEPYTDAVPPPGTTWAPVSCDVPPGGLEGCLLDLRTIPAKESR
jgi:hypothetical protein